MKGKYIKGHVLTATIDIINNTILMLNDNIIESFENSTSEESNAITNNNMKLCLSVLEDLESE